MKVRSCKDKLPQNMKKEKHENTFLSFFSFSEKNLKLLCNFTVLVRMETTLYRNDRFPWQQLEHQVAIHTFESEQPSSSPTDLAF